MRWLVRLAAAQGAYFALTGAWALVHVESFMAVTGPKTDVWLVKTVGILVLAIGLALLVAAARLRIPFEMALLALASAAGLGAIEIIYGLAGTISPIYLLDALLEGALVFAWAALLWRARHDLRLWGRSPGAGRGGSAAP